MPLFRKDPERKAVERRAKWLESLEPELQGLGSSLLAEVPNGWKVGRIDRERFRGGMETFGIATGDGSGQVACGVSTTPAGALEALLARLRGKLSVTPVWAPDAGENRDVEELGSLAAMEAFGWEVRTDGESYGLYGIDVTGAFASLGEDGPDQRIVGVVVGGGRDRSGPAREALAALVTGELEVARLWAPA